MTVFESEIMDLISESEEIARLEERRVWFLGLKRDTSDLDYQLHLARERRAKLLKGMYR